MNVSEIITAFGAYYLNSGQNMNNILRMLTQGAVTPSFMTPIKTEETIYRMSSVTVGSLVQSFQKDWTPSDPGIFVPNEIRKRHMKIDIDIFPDDIYQHITAGGALATTAAVNLSDYVRAFSALSRK